MSFAFQCGLVRPSRRPSRSTLREGNRAFVIAVSGLGMCLPGCLIYDDALLETANADAEPSGGARSAAGGVGAAPELGGVGGTPVFGSDVGGTSGTQAVGAGGVASLPEPPQGDGGSVSGPSDVLLIDFSGGASDYASEPFYGRWDRVGDPYVAWDVPNVLDMVVEVPGEPSNYALRVAATSATDWGVDVYFTFRDTGTAEPADLSDFAGVRFSARTSDANERLLRVALEDIASNYVASCPSGPDCTKHAQALPAAALPSHLGWQEYSLPFSNFIQGSRSVPLDLTNVFGLHFTMDPPSGSLEFWLDDIYLYR